MRIQGRLHGTSLLLLTVLLLCPLVLGACRSNSAEADPETKAHAGTEADSLALAAGDSLAGAGAGADTAGVEEAKSKGGFLAKIFGRGRGDEKEEEEKEAVPVKLAAVRLDDVPLYLSATATLEAEKSADVLAKIRGEILRIEAEEGDWVDAGQSLAVLDGKVERVRLEEAVARTRASELDLERVASLHEMGLTSDKELHDATYRFDEAKAQEKAARLQVEYTRIVAPFSGRICERSVDPGQTVAVGTKIFSIADLDPLLARIHLPEKEAGRILPRQGVVVNPDADPSSTFSGEVLRVAPMVDPRTGTVKTTCQVGQQSSTLKPGSFVRVKIQTDMHPDVLVIPKRALVPEGGETYVFKAEADTVVKVPVATGYANGTLIEITGGLEEGDRVVTVGQGGLKTGSRFREISDEPEAVVAASDTSEGTLP